MVPVAASMPPVDRIKLLVDDTYEIWFYYPLTDPELLRATLAIMALDKPVAFGWNADRTRMLVECDTSRLYSIAQLLQPKVPCTATVRFGSNDETSGEWAEIRIVNLGDWSTPVGVARKISQTLKRSARADGLLIRVDDTGRSAGQSHQDWADSLVGAGVAAAVLPA